MLGNDAGVWKDVIGPHGDGEANDNGRILLELCGNNTLFIMNTFFVHRDVHEYIRRRDSLGQQSLIDFCIVSTDLFRSVLDVRVRKESRTIDRSSPGGLQLACEKDDGPGDSTVGIGNPERHMRKASHCGSKQQ